MSAERNISQGPTAGLVAYWPLNGDGTDASGNGRHLAVKTDRVTWVPGYAGQAAEMGVDPWEGSCFNSDGGALTAPGAGVTYPGSGDWTVEAWVRFDSIEESYTVVSHYSEHIAGHEPYQLRIDSGGQLFFAITSSGNQTDSVSAPLLGDGSGWIHVAAVYRYRQSLEIYENSRLLALAPTSLVPETLPHYDVYVGGNFCTTSTGLIVDEARISSSARYQHGMIFADGFESGDLTAWR